MSGLLPHEKAAFKTALKALHKELMEPEPLVYEGHEIVPIPAICTGPRKHEWIDGNGNGAIRAPTLRQCRCFYCGHQLKPHPAYPAVVDAETRRKQTPIQKGMDLR